MWFLALFYSHASPLLSSFLHLPVHCYTSCQICAIMNVHHCMHLSAFAGVTQRQKRPIHENSKRYIKMGNIKAPSEVMQCIEIAPW